MLCKKVYIGNSFVLFYFKTQLFESSLVVWLIPHLFSSLSVLSLSISTTPQVLSSVHHCHHKQEEDKTVSQWCFDHCWWYSWQKLQIEAIHFIFCSRLLKEGVYWHRLFLYLAEKLWKDQVSFFFWEFVAGVWGMRSPLVYSKKNVSGIEKRVSCLCAWCLHSYFLFSKQ